MRLINHPLPERFTRRPLAVAFVVCLAAIAQTLALGATARAAEAAPVTYQGQSYTSATSNPTGDKPQSKLWYQDGAWWALMLSPNDASVHIYELMVDHTWRDTGTVVDTRSDSTGDALWNGTFLYVASRQASSPLRVSRFSYDTNTRTWAPSSGFPVSVGTGGSESATIAQDTTGTLWVTYTQGKKVLVARTTTDDRIWTAPFSPNVPDVSISSDDISAVISFDGKVGVLWSDQSSQRFGFAIHADGAPDSQWTSETALSGALLVDDHINLKSLAADTQGRIFAAIKMSQDASGVPTATNVAVLTRSGSGSWSLHPVATVADDLTRPIIMIDETNSELYLFATTSVGGGAINYKKASLSDLAFPPGPGQPFVSWPNRFLNNASGSKQPVNAGTGLVVLASDPSVRRYFHAELAIQAPAPPPDVSPPTVPTGVRVAAVSSSQVDVSWSASEDNVSVAGYRVRRDETTIASPTDLSFSDTTVAPQTRYAYSVSAVDVAGNQSAWSDPITVTTPAPSTPPPSSAIAFRAATTGSVAGGQALALTLDVPAVPAGDVMLATVDVRGVPTITPPAGWTLVRDDVGGTTMRTATYWHAAGTSEPSSYTWSFNKLTSAAGSVAAYSGVSVTNPIVAHAGQYNAASALATAPSVTTNVSGAEVVRLFAVPAMVGLAAPSGTTERAYIAPSTLTYKVSALLADHVQAAAGATGTVASTVSTAKFTSIGQTVALRPAG